MTAALLACLVFSGFDVGGRVAGIYPVAGFSRYHASSALLGADIGYSSGRLRIELGYDITSLPGLGATTYRFDLHHFAGSLGYLILKGPGWGLNLGASLGAGFGSRSYGPGRESGWLATSQFGADLVQFAGRSRLSIGPRHTLLLEFEDRDPVVVAIGQLFSIRAGVAYVF